jgi:hypothetical protein
VGHGVYHIDDIGIGAMYIAFEGAESQGGPFDEAAKDAPSPRDIAAKVIDQADWLASSEALWRNRLALHRNAVGSML